MTGGVVDDTYVRTDGGRSALGSWRQVEGFWDGKGSALVDLMEPTVMTFYAKACGSELARAHARAGDAVAIASYLGTNDTFDRALALSHSWLRRPSRNASASSASSGARPWRHARGSSGWLEVRYPDTCVRKRCNQEDGREDLKT